MPRDTDRTDAQAATTVDPPTPQELERAVAALTALCERLPEGESRANALAHLRTTARWAERALSEG